MDDEKFGQRLKAFVVPQQGTSSTRTTVKDYVKDNLANYKVPREVVFLDELPRNHTGKVLKRELAEHGSDAKSESDAGAASEGEQVSLAGVALEEAQHPSPGVLARLRVVREPPVEE